MSTARSRDALEDAPSPPDNVTIVVWPARDATLSFGLVLTGVGTVALLAGWLSHRAAMGGVVLVLLLLALWRLWLPVTYQLDRRGIVERVLGRSRYVSWLAITAVQLQDRGMILKADRANVPLAAIDALYIPWGGKQAEMTAMVQYFVPHRMEPSEAVS